VGLRIQNNVEAFNAHRQLNATAAKASKSMEKLSSGYRVNRAADDAAGLAISEKMRGQIGGLAQAQRNAQDAISMVQTGEGALGEVHAMLQRVRDLRVQFENGTLSADDKAAILSEVKQLGTEMAEIQKNTEFNDIKLLQGDIDGAGPGGASIDFQVGANTGETLTVTTVDLNGASGLGSIDGLSAATGTAEFSTITLDAIDVAINNVAKIRSDFGAVQNRLEHRLNNLATYQENLVASESRIRDVDMAAEMVTFTKLGILQQAGTSMLAQANQSPQGVLSLLQG
jgi:flagellin